MRFWLGPWEWRTSPMPAWNAPGGSKCLVDLRSIPQCAAKVTPQGFGLFVTANATNLGSSYANLGTDPLQPWNAQAKARWRAALGLPQSLVANHLRDAIWETVTHQSDPTGDDRCKPLMPTMQRKLEIDVPGLGPVERRFIRGDGEAMPIMDLLRREYRQLRADSLNGLMRDAAGQVDLSKYRKILGFWVRKYGLNYRDFQPGDVPDESPQEPETTITDDFNRADEPLETGGNWTLDTDGWDVVSNRVDYTGGDSKFARRELDLSGSDHYAQFSIAVSASATAHGLGPTVRYASGALTFYSAFLYRDGDSLQLAKYVSGSQTNITSASVTPSLAELYKCEINGSTLKGYQAGVERVSTTDTSISSGTRGGLWGYRFGATTQSLDDFEAADLGGGGGGIIYTQLERNTRGLVRGVYGGSF